MVCARPGGSGGARDAGGCHRRVDRAAGRERLSGRRDRCRFDEGRRHERGRRTRPRRSARDRRSPDGGVGAERDRCRVADAVRRRLPCPHARRRHGHRRVPAAARLRHLARRPRDLGAGGRARRSGGRHLACPARRRGGAHRPRGRARALRRAGPPAAGRGRLQGHDAHRGRKSRALDRHLPGQRGRRHRGRRGAARRPRRVLRRAQPARCRRARGVAC